MQDSWLFIKRQLLFFERKGIYKMETQQLLRELPKGLIKWYDFDIDKRVLCIVNDNELTDSIVEAVKEMGLDTECISLKKIESGMSVDGVFGYIIAAGILEYSKKPEELLSLLHKKLSPHGRLLLGTDNRLASRYFCGDKDPFTGRNFDGLENYVRVSAIDQDSLLGHNFSKAEIINLLHHAGFSKYRFYSVFPEISSPQILFAEDFKPQEQLDSRIFLQYNCPDTIFLEEENLYNALIENDMFHTMANGFFIECSIDGTFSNVNQVTISMERGKENALCTILRRDKKVEKRPVYKEGNEKVQTLMDNNMYLKNHGVCMVDAIQEKESFVMPYVTATPLTDYFRELILTDVPKFLEELDKYWKLILQSSEHMNYDEINWEQFEPYWEKKKKDDLDWGKWRKVAYGSKEEQESLGVILKRGYIDLVPINAFFVKDNFMFYDQEMYVENLPAKCILLRTIDFIYSNNTRIESIFPRLELLKRYKINQYQELFYSFIWYFLSHLHNDRALEEMHRKRRRNDEVVHSNRQRMNYSAQEYENLFVKVFSNIENKKIYLFGSGNFTKKFLALYQEDYNITAILDNNSDKQGKKMEGIEIVSPSILENEDPSTYKLIICIKNYTGVLKQVKALGATNIGIYDTNMEYPRKPKMLVSINKEKESKPKKYHIGYVAGVFDLFHIGHLNLLKRAKEQCDYLIVGVVTDEGVRKNKHTETFIPFEERLEIVQACRYVDEAVGIPYEFCDTKDAYLKFQFDAQFSGSDYVDDSDWKRKQVFLREHGAELVFFPYTESISSSKLKQIINKKLI